MTARLPTNCSCSRLQTEPFGFEGEVMMIALVRRVMREAIYRKPAAHCFDKPGEITEKAAMAAIGG